MNESHSSAIAELDRDKVVSPRGLTRLTNPWVALALLAVSHFLVDVVAGTTNPIWPALERNLSLQTGGLLWVYVCWSVSTSFSQLLFALWADRRPCRWLIWTGPLLAILTLSCLGLARSSYMLVGLFVIGGLGVAAFHPEAAATAGSLLPGQRSRAMAIFALCGYLGQSVGPYYSGAIIEHLGLRGLTWGIWWGVPILAALWIGLRSIPVPAKQQPHATIENIRIPFGTWILLLAVGAFRILPALGVPLALAYLLEAASAPSSVIGAVQSAFMAGIGIGAMACAAFLRHRWERRTLWIFPLASAPILAILTVVSGWTLVLLVGTCGVLLGVTMPVYISYGQQLLPHGQRVASSITMGVSWGIGGALVATAMWFFNSLDALPYIFGFFAIASLASSLLCHLLPYPDQS